MAVRESGPQNGRNIQVFRIFLAETDLLRQEEDIQIRTAEAPSATKSDLVLFSSPFDPRRCGWNSPWNSSSFRLTRGDFFDDDGNWTLWKRLCQANKGDDFFLAASNILNILILTFLGSVSMILE